LPPPNSLTIPVNLTDSVERNPPKLTGFIQKLKGAAVTRWKYNLLKWDTVNPAFPSIPIADLKAASAKFLVVADAAQQFVDRRHAGPKVSGHKAVIGVCETCLNRGRESLGTSENCLSELG
jgi:hypothetical protein